MERYLLKEKGTVLVEGRAIGQRIGAGPVKVIHDVSEMDKVQPGDVLVSDMTDPDWEPVMKRASAIVTNRGGRTCHAAIIARELGIPAVVGCGNATRSPQGWPARYCLLCGRRYRPDLRWRTGLRHSPELHRRHAGAAVQDHDERRQPGSASSCRTGGLEFIINRMIGVHPNAAEFEAGRREEQRALVTTIRSASRGSKASAPRQQRSGRRRSSCACRTSSPTSTPT